MSAVRELAAARPLRLGFAGLGWIGRKRLDAIATRAGIAVSALCDPLPQAVENAAMAFPDAVASADFAEFLRADLDGVVIATPNALHAAQAIQALERGVAVFCQKPLALSARDTQAVVTAARTANRRLGVDYCYRHVAGMHTLRERIANGELGEVLFVDMKFHNAYGPDKRWCYDKSMSGGGCLLDLGVHLVDLAVWLLGIRELEVMSADLFAARQTPVRCRSADIEDIALAQLRDERGASLRLACSWNLNAGQDCEIEFAVYGTKAGARWRNVNGSFYDFVLEWARGTQRETLGAPPDEWGDRALCAWAEALRVDNTFDAEALSFVPTARVLDMIYAKHI
jgi:predicted dehydrogenase